jgi:hypothetical protein
MQQIVAADMSRRVGSTPPNLGGNSLGQVWENNPKTAGHRGREHLPAYGFQEGGILMAQQSATAGQSRLTQAENVVKAARTAVLVALAVVEVLRRAGVR